MAYCILAVPTPALPETGRESALVLPYYATKQECLENDCFFFIPDFCCDKEKLIIELDGGIHDGRIEKDFNRDKILQNPGLCALPIRNEELSDIESVLSKIKRNFG